MVLSLCRKALILPKTRDGGMSQSCGSSWKPEGQSGRGAGVAVPGSPIAAPHPPGTGWAPGRSSRCGRTGRAARWWRCSVGFPPRPRPSLLAAPSARPQVPGRCGSGTGGCRQVWGGSAGGPAPATSGPAGLLVFPTAHAWPRPPSPTRGLRWALGWVSLCHPRWAPTPVPRHPPADRRRLRAAVPAGLYHLDEEVADLAQDDDEAGGRAVVLAVGADQAEGAHHPVQVGLQLREHRPSLRGRRGGQSRGASEPTRSLGIGAATSARTRKPGGAAYFGTYNLPQSNLLAPSLPAGSEAAAGRGRCPWLPPGLGQGRDRVGAGGASPRGRGSRPRCLLRAHRRGRP